MKYKKKNKFIKYLSFILLLFTAVSFLPAVTCQAASAKVHLSVEHNEVKVGETVYIYIKINSGTIFSDFEANLTYDKNILKYKGGASVISGDSGYLRISDRNNGQTDTSRKYALEFQALKTGECEIAFDDEVVVYDESGNALPVSSDSANITVKAKKSASHNSYLKSLKTSPKNITPDFNKKVYDYNINVDHNTKKLIISAIPEDDKANVSIKGNDFLKEGENKIIITVLAESGDIIEYTIKVFREAAPTVTINPTVTVTPPVSEGSANTFKIEQENGTTYAIYSGKYKLVEPGSDVVIPVGYSKSAITISGVTITAYAPNNNPNSDFVLIYAENNSGQAGFYQFDRIENTMQRYMNTTADSADNQSDTNNAATIIILLITLCALLGAAVIWLVMKLRAGKEDLE